MVKGLNYPCYPCWDSELMCTSKLFIQLSWRKLCIWWFLPLPGTQGHFHTSLPSLIKPLSLVPFEPRLTSFALMIKASQRRSADSPSWHVAEYRHIHKPNQPRPAEPYSWTFVTKRRFLHHTLLRFVSLDSITSLRTNLRHGGGCCPVPPAFRAEFSVSVAGFSSLRIVPKTQPTFALLHPCRGTAQVQRWVWSWTKR